MIISAAVVWIITIMFDYPGHMYEKVDRTREVESIEEYPEVFEEPETVL